MKTLREAAQNMGLTLMPHYIDLAATIDDLQTRIAKLEKE